MPYGRHVGGGVVEPPVRLAHEHREGRSVPSDVPVEEDDRGALALHGQSLPFQILDDAREVRVVERFAAFVQPDDVERVVYLLVFDPARGAQRFPRGQGLLVSRLELDHALPRSRLEFLVDVEPPLGGLVERHEISEVDVPGGFRAQRGGELVAKVFHEHPELRSPVANVVESEDVVAREGEEVGERVADDGGAEVAHVHFLGDVGR
mmetsp:Transcript_31711/g.58691  ORF Transcript_31711/g.58691 Transcript_31711/m.58691 type:complete len:207 (-) Transcript_31711:50-670(-)